MWEQHADQESFLAMNEATKLLNAMVLELLKLGATFEGVDTVKGLAELEEITQRVLPQDQPEPVPPPRWSNVYTRP